MKPKLEPLVLDNPLILIYQPAHLIEAGGEGYRKLQKAWLHIMNSEGNRGDYEDWLWGLGRWSKDGPTSS